MIQNENQVIARYKVDNNFLKSTAVLLRETCDPFLLNSVKLIIKFNLNNEDIISEYDITDDELSGLRQCIYIQKSNPSLYKEILYPKLIDLYSKTIAIKLSKIEDTERILKSIYLEQYF